MEHCKPSAFRANLAIWEKVASVDLKDLAQRRGLAEAHEQVSYTQDINGDVDGALQSFGKGLAIRELLHRSRPEMLILQGDLLEAYKFLHNLQVKRGNLQALQSLRARQAILEDKARRFPDIWNREPADNFQGIGATYLELKNFQDGLAALREGRRVAAAGGKAVPPPVLASVLADFDKMIKRAEAE